MLMSIVFFYFCYMLHFFVTPFWLVCVHIFSFVSIFVSFFVFFLKLACRYAFDILIISVYNFFSLIYYETTTSLPCLNGACAMT